MKAAFFHDHKFRRDKDGSYYSPGGLPYSVLARYLHHFEEVAVVGRELPVGDDYGEKRLTRASGEGVTMRCLTGGSRVALVAGARVRNHVREVLDASDCAIIRLPSMLGLAAAREAVRLRKPWMAEVVACAWDALWNHGQVGGKLAAAPMYVLTRHFVAQAPWVTYVSQEFLQRRYPSAGRAIGCSDVSIEEPDESVLARRLNRVAARVQGQSITLGMVGSLDVDYKGHGTALTALKTIRERGVDARLRCLGGGSAERWRRLAAKLGVGQFVEFSGVRASGKPVLDWMDQLDIYLIPSRQEGLPRALVEAMSRALPAVGARIGGIPELLPDEWLHAPKGGYEAAEKILRLAANSEIMARCASENFSMATQYARPALDETRDGFLRSFAEDVRRHTTFGATR